MTRSVSPDSSYHAFSQVPAVDEGCKSMTALSVEDPLLMVTLDRGGMVLAAFGPLLSSALRAHLQTWVGQPLGRLLPQESHKSWEICLQQVLSASRQGQFTAQLELPERSLMTRWVLSLSPTSRRVVALVYPLEESTFPTAAVDSSTGWQVLQTCAELQEYAPQLSQITRNIRRTLDLETIWRQTVDGLGSLFRIERAWVCTYQAADETVTIRAEFCSSRQLGCWQDRALTLAEWSPLQHAIAAPQPITSTHAWLEKPTSLLAIASRYQDQVNGLIVLHALQERAWTPVELDLITELADQVGTAVAHARLIGESNALTSQLQQANARLLDKHRELEEARRQAEEARKQAEEASRLKSEFLANTSHELRTPLNGMIGFLKLVLDGMADDPEEQVEFIQEAHKSAIHLLNLINDVLDIAKIEAGKMQIEMVPVNLRELLSDVENFTRPLAEQKGLQFAIRVPPTRDEIMLNGNYQRLLQVLLNLVGNAIKFTHEGGVTITAEIKSQKVNFQEKVWPGFVKVSVADTGIGVSLEKQDRLFQTFSQVDGERTRQYGGTGLGLAISQKLVEAMGGVVQFISMGEGLGATVTFTALLYQEPVVISTEPT